MRPGLGRSLSPPRRLGGWGDPLGAISKWGRASSHDGDNMLRQARRYAACLLFSSLLQASGSGSVCHATCASTSWSIRFFFEGAMLTACLTQSRQLDRPADGIGRWTRGQHLRQAPGEQRGLDVFKIYQFLCKLMQDIYPQSGVPGPVRPRGSGTPVCAACLKFTNSSVNWCRTYPQSGVPGPVRPKARRANVVVHRPALIISGKQILLLFATSVSVKQLQGSICM